jgi:hypothetical protein
MSYLAFYCHIGFISVKKIRRNINLGTAVNRSDNPKARWTNMAMIALGSKW